MNFRTYLKEAVAKTKNTKTIELSEFYDKYIEGTKHSKEFDDDYDDFFEYVLDLARELWGSSNAKVERIRDTNTVPYEYFNKMLDRFTK